MARLHTLAVAECRCTGGAVNQEAIAAFAYKVEVLRRTLDIPVAGMFMTKTSRQIGALRVGQFNGIQLVTLEEDATPPGFYIAFLRYDAEREERDRDIIMNLPPGSYGITGMPATLI